MTTYDPLSQEGLILDHRFRLGAFLGSGAIHCVFSAQDLLEDQVVCVKIPRLFLRENDGFSLRYRRDVLNVIMHSHPGWVTPQLLGEHDGQPFQVLPLIDGQTVPQWYESVGRDERKLLEVMKRALYILSQMHRITGATHGGIKPENLLITEKGEPLFLDLVATGRLEDHFTEKAQTGRPVYHSPEQLVGERAGPASDLYSFGLVIYQALAGRHPFAAGLEQTDTQDRPERLLTSMLEQLQGSPMSASSFREDVPRWADRFLSRCLLPRPDERFQTAEEAHDWLRHHSGALESGSAEHRPLPPAGREQEMAFLLECLEDIVKDPPQGSIIRLHGSVGVGKTRCTQWLADQARRRGVRLIDVHRSAESGLNLQSVANALMSQHSGEVADARPVVEYLIEAALDEPQLLLLDDVQSCDETLVWLLDELNSVVSDLRILVVISEDESPFRTEAAKTFVETLDHVLILTPLDRRAIANLIEERCWSAPSAALASWVHKVTSGNALAAKLLLEYLQAHGHLKDEVELDWASSPAVERPDLETLLGWKIGTLSPTTRLLLESGAVLGDPFNLSTLHAITYHHPEEVDAAMSEAVKLELLQVGSRHGPTTFAWSHPLYRSVLTKQLPPRRRQRIHRLAAAFYSRGEPEPNKLAYHFFRSEDDQEFFHWGNLAVAKARRLGRRGEANSWFLQLIQRVPTKTWLGPDLTRAQQDIARDQSETLDFDVWTLWFTALSGRTFQGDLEELDLSDPLYSTQALVSARLAWPIWKKFSALTLTELEDRSRRDPKGAAPFQRAISLLRAEWFLRRQDGEPFPGETD